jgi:hypothetical protein
LAHKLIARLRKSNFVISRTLPKNAGHAIVLSAAGARYLQRHLNLTIRPGDKWGRSTGGTWHAPTSWEHELLVTLVMLNFISLGVDVRTELEVRTHNPGLRKYPDGLTRYEAEHNNETVEVVQWIEVESADKSGAKMLTLARSLTAVQRNQAPVLCGWRPNVPVVVYRADMRDLSGRPIDHKNRITSAIRRHIGANLPLYFRQIKLKNAAYHVEEIIDEPVTIKPFDLNDTGVNLSTTAFSANKHGTFINHSIDRNGHTWTLKVYRYEDRYRWEVWDLPEPHEQHHTPRSAYQIEDLEQGFRVALHEWRTKYY